MKSEFLLAFNQICSERNLSKEVVLEALQTALVSAYRRNINASSAQNVVAEVDTNTGAAKIYVEKEVVEAVQDDRTEVSLEVARQIVPDSKLADMVMIESTPEDFGRIAAQTAKQVILQRIREAERDALYTNFSEREGEIINGTVQSVSSQGVTLNLGRTEALLPKNQQVPGERYSVHQRLRAYVLEVRKTSRGPQIIVSRNHKNMLRRLLELEVPEIYNGTVEIKSIAREAGARSKIAVAAKQAGVDPVGSCVGMKGVRIQSIVSELGGEKIDVIEWNSDSSVYILKALSPARVLTVHPDDDPVEGRTALVIVPDDQLSLAIGREGQNARLAAKLTGWRIDIKSAVEAATEAVRRAQAPEMAERLTEDVRNNLPTAEAILQRHAEQSLPWNSEELLALRQVIDSVQKLLSADREASRAAAGAAVEAARAPQAAAAAERTLDLQALLARIPPVAFETQLDDLGLSARVFSHLEKAGLANVGHVMQRLVEGDEAMLSVEGIGPKALAEIKTQIEAKGMGFLPEVAPAQPEAAAAAEETVPAAEAAAPEAELTLPVPEVTPPEVEVAAPVGAIVPPVEMVAPAEAPSAVAEVVPAVPQEAVATVPIAPGVIEEALGDEEFDEDEIGKGGKKKKKGLTLVFDERVGAVVAKRQRKPGRQREAWEEE
jgi:transcription termination/antitermination protein NusA